MMSAAPDNRDSHRWAAGGDEMGTLAERRMRALRRLLDQAGASLSLEECLHRAAKSLGGSGLDLPFMLLYAVDDAGENARLVARVGIAPDAPAAPEELELMAMGAWPFIEALDAGCPVSVPKVQERFPGLAAEPNAELVRRAYVLPINPMGPRASALVVAGMGTRLPADEAEESFFHLLSATLTSIAAKTIFSNLALAKLRPQTAGELTMANQELEAFSYSLAHDLRGPLRGIDGFSRALLRDYAEKLDEHGRHYLERVRAGTKRMARLIDDLLSLSRVSRAPLHRQRVDLTGISRRILTGLGERDPERNVDAKVASGLAGNGDVRLVTVMLENLLGNAWKFSSKQAAVRIDVGGEERDGERVFYVRDNGAGFDMEYADKLFIQFQRLHSGSEFPGTGIGLAIVHRVVTRHGGRVWAESSLNQGATFFFTLGVDS
jgi:signal transduction histidine kinase